MSGRLCLLSLLRHSRYPLHSLPTHVQHVRTEAPPRLQHDPLGHIHGYEHSGHESFSTNLNHNLLSNYSSLAHPDRRHHQLLHL